MSYFCWAPPDVIAPLLTSKVWFERICEPLLQTLDRYTGGQNDELLKKMLFLEMSHFLVDHNLNYTDKLSMAVGVETRVPFLDHRMVDYACRLPITYKLVVKVNISLKRRWREYFPPMLSIALKLALVLH